MVTAKSLGLGQSPQLELKVCPRSGPYLVVNINLGKTILPAIIGPKVAYYMIQENIPAAPPLSCIPPPIDSGDIVTKP